MILYGGFCEGKLDWREIDDGWGGGHHRMAPALFKSRKEARVQYEDVRPIEIAVKARKKKARIR